MVDISGMYQPEMYILPDEAKMKSLNITQDQLKEAIDQNNRVSGSLSIRDGYYQYNIKFTSQLMSVEDVREVYLNIEGRLMQVKDIAEVGIRPRDKRGMFVNGEKQSLCMAVIKQSSARMSEMKEKVSEMLENFETEYPDIEFSVSGCLTELLDYEFAAEFSMGDYPGCIYYVVFLAGCPFTDDYRDQYTGFCGHQCTVFPVDRFVYQYHFSLRFDYGGGDDDR